MEEVTNGRAIFEKACGYCGARFRVVATHVPEGDDVQAFACPECGRQYKTHAASQPEVELVTPRTDGRDGAYQETMF